MRGVLYRTIREAWLATVLFALGLLLAERLLAFVLPQIQSGLNEFVLQLPFARTLISGLLGIDVEGGITAQLLQAFVWVHPVVLALIWGHEIMFCTRWPAGEIDRGTIDVLLGLPVSRRRVYWCESAVWAVSGVLIIGTGSIGYFLGARNLPEAQRPEVARVLLVLVNLFCVYLAVGGGAYLISSLSARRGRAVAVVFSLLIGSFLLNFLAQFWPPAERVAFLGVLNYYQPARILGDGVLPVADVLVLVGFGVVTWVLGGEILARRSIATL